MCAAPGSKTSQLLEDLHRGTTHTKPPSILFLRHIPDITWHMTNMVDMMV
jgi:hypothetical protein